MYNKNIILTGDRPTGKLHLGHYVGSLKARLTLQEDNNNEMFIMIADMQALTDNMGDIDKIRKHVIEVLLDYLSIGIDPNKTTIFVQSQVPALSELTMYYMNLVSVGRLGRNPTIKSEIKQRGFNESVPTGFFCYPISQAADITAFNANIVPVGEDQLPMLEQTKEIVKSFNSIYGETLIEPKILLPDSNSCKRLPGIDGKSKMSKSSNNGIYLSDSSEDLLKKIMSMYTDPNHIRVEDPGNVENNTVFTYLDAFCEDTTKLNELKEHYQKGGLGDVKVKKYLYEVLENKLEPFRKKRKEYENNMDELYKILDEGNKKANKVANQTLTKVKQALGINYFQ